MDENRPGADICSTGPGSGDLENSEELWADLTWILDSVRQQADAEMMSSPEAVLSGAIASSMR
jgi:hypothetical protein